MTYLPATTDVATREDVRALERRMDNRFEAMQQQVDARFEAMQQQVDARFEAMQQQIDARFEAVRVLLEERFGSLEHQIRAGDDSTASTLRQEMNRQITSQTRTIVFALVGAITANTSLVLLAT